MMAFEDFAFEEDNPTQSIQEPPYTNVSSVSKQ